MQPNQDNLLIISPITACPRSVLIPLTARELAAVYVTLTLVVAFNVVEQRPVMQVTSCANLHCAEVRQKVFFVLFLDMLN